MGNYDSTDPYYEDIAGLCNFMYSKWLIYEFYFHIRQASGLTEHTSAHQTMPPCRTLFGHGR